LNKYAELSISFWFCAILVIIFLYEIDMGALILANRSNVNKHEKYCYIRQAV